MLDFSLDYNITGGPIDNWYVDDQYTGIRTPIIQPATADATTTSALGETELGGVIGGDMFNEISTIHGDKKCNERLKLLAMSYSDLIQPELHRDIQARLLILEHELDNLIPRYTERDWELLLEFKQSINELNEE